MRRIISKLVVIDASNEKIAFGFAIGVFMGITPYWGFHTMFAFLFAALLRGNVVAAILGVHVGNPLTAPLLFASTYWVGSKFIDSDPICFAWKDFSLDAAIRLFSEAPHIIMVLSIGALVIGLPLSGLAYWLAKIGMAGYRARNTAKEGE
ncbi:MAG: DUF2062 domain-containing protein [Deltaproteobacteria bacterium]|nr:DUF2062 domain-containing protein [Deltaproteobacteria bacterium]